MRGAAQKRKFEPPVPWDQTHYARALDDHLNASAMAGTVAAQIRALGASFYAHGYLCKPAMVAGIHSAITQGVPIFAAGEPGSGKTRLAEVLTAIYNPDEDLLAIHCHSDLTWQELVFRWDEDRRSHHWHASRERASRGEPIDWTEVESIARSRQMMIRGPLLEALDYKARRVVLVDEADKAPKGITHMWYQFLNDFTIQHPDLGYLEAEPECLPIVIITANEFQGFEEAFLRRVAFLNFELPLITTEAEILSIAAASLDEELRNLLLLVVTELRGSYVRLDKPITISEVIDTAHAWIGWGITSATPGTFELSLPYLAKTREDQHRVARKIRPALARVWDELFVEHGSLQRAIEALAYEEQRRRDLRNAKL